MFADFSPNFNFNTAQNTEGKNLCENLPWDPVTFHSEPCAHFVLVVGVRLVGQLDAAVVAAVVLQAGAADAQSQVVLSVVSLQPISLVLVRSCLALLAPVEAGATEEHGAGAGVAQTPHHVHRGVQSVCRVCEGAGQHCRVTLDGSYLRGNLNGPGVIVGW